MWLTGWVHEPYLRQSAKLLQLSRRLRGTAALLPFADHSGAMPRLGPSQGSMGDLGCPHEPRTRSDRNPAYVNISGPPIPVIRTTANLFDLLDAPGFRR